MCPQPVLSLPSKEHSNRQGGFNGPCQDPPATRIQPQASWPQSGQERRFVPGQDWALRDPAQSRKVIPFLPEVTAPYTKERAVLDPKIEPRGIKHVPQLLCHCLLGGGWWKQRDLAAGELQFSFFFFFFKEKSEQVISTAPGGKPASPASAAFLPSLPCLPPIKSPLVAQCAC